MSEKRYKLIKQSGRHYADKKCMWCGEYFKPDEELAVMVVHSDYKKEYKKVSGNVIMHMSEINTLIDKYGDNEDAIVLEIINHKIPRVSNEITEQQMVYLEAFKGACKFYGLTVETTAKDEIHMRSQGSSLMACYNIRTDKIGITHRGKGSLFDGFYMNEIRANVFNKMQEILGTDVRDNYKANETINKVFGDVNKLISNGK